MKAIILVRVSTDYQAMSGNGVMAQADVCHEFAKKEGFAQVEVVQELGVSGGLSLDKRPLLVDAISRLGKGDALIVYRHDRLSRDSMTQAVITRLVQRRGAKILSASGVGNDETPEGMLMKSIVQAMACYERSLAVMRTKAVSDSQRKNGKRFTRHAPWGFRWDGGTMVIDEKEQEAIEIAKSCRAQGMTWKATAEALFEAGHRNRKGQKMSLHHLHISFNKHMKAAA